MYRAPGDRPTCDVVIPCRDEAPALPAVFATMPEGFHVIVVDNGSTDGTADVALELGAEVVFEARPGYGAAVHAGTVAATAPLVAVLDGDGSMDPAELSELVAVVSRGEASMAVGRRRPRHSRVWPWHARAGTAALAWMIRRRSGFGIHDLAPMRVCRREDLLALGVADRRFGYPLELMIKASDAGWTVHERDVVYSERARGTRSKVSGSVRGTCRTLIDFAKVLR
ncbi:glycosyltransferase family 2 protein [Nesterenkonia marinintestina]|uniref:glycosyltransferase family 2 protein n=1 Tax=Nesterenkonia marinintestina TaxID=2979865 RepID=UPI0021BE0DAE|nr:glycosyltransferase family 2 protein [Nesterenkonia sp. GX14115]